MLFELWSATNGLLFVKLHQFEQQEGQDGEILPILHRKANFNTTIHLSDVADDG